MASATFNERDLMRRSVTMIVTVHRPIHHRAIFWLGFKVIAFGAWLAGFAGARVEHEQCPPS